MKTRKYELLLGFFILLNLALSIYLVLKGNSGNDYLCTTGSNCDDVRNSIYGTLFGLKLAWVGVISFTLLLVLFLLAKYDRSKYWMFFSASMIGLVFALYFISLQLFVLKKICTDCLIIDVITVIMFLIAFFEYISFRKEFLSVEKDIESAEAKVFK